MPKRKPDLAGSIDQIHTYYSTHGKRAVQIPKIETARVIKDPVHGYVPMTCAEYDLIQLPLFVRLHRVRQNSMAYMTYPGATTSRFEHVVGSMFTGSKIVTQVLGEMGRDDFASLFPGLEAGHGADLLVKSVRLACLFHDVGHGPFSHAGERIMASVTPAAEMEEAESLLGRNPALHEYFSYKLALTDGVRSILEREDPMLPEAVASLLVEKAAGGLARENGAGLAAFRKMVSGQLDADRADYLARDSLMAGVGYGRIDSDRIISNMAAVQDKQGEYELAVHHRALGAVEDMLDARFKMYKWFYRHHAVAAADNLLEEALVQAVDDGSTDGNLFHWRSMEGGLGDDDSVLGTVAAAWRADPEKYEYYRGLWDRRHFPVSLLKRQSDYSEFARRTMEITGRSMTDADILERIEQFTASGAKANLVDDPALAGPLSAAHTMIRFAGGVPYSPLSPSDRIWMHTDDGRLHEIREQSAYTKHINEAWMSHPSVYFSFVVPGLRKGDLTPDMKEKLRDAMIKTIFQ